MDPAKAEKPAAQFSSFRFRCAHCDKVHTGLPDICFPVPDCMRTLPEVDFAERCLVNDDICILDGHRYFIYCILEVPVQDHPDRFGWGVWCEVNWVPFKRYWEVVNGSTHVHPPSTAGRVANNLSHLPSTKGLKCDITFRRDDMRPQITLPPSKHDMYRIQQNGLSVKQAITQAQSVGTLLQVA